MHAGLRVWEMKMISWQHISRWHMQTCCFLMKLCKKEAQSLQLTQKGSNGWEVLATSFSLVLAYKGGCEVLSLTAWSSHQQHMYGPCTHFVTEFVKEISKHNLALAGIESPTLGLTVQSSTTRLKQSPEMMLEPPSTVNYSTIWWGQVITCSCHKSWIQCRACALPSTLA